MKFGLSWGVKQMRPEAREIAEAAARRSGMSLDAWLNSVIIQQAGQGRVASPPLSDDAFHGGELETVNQRLDVLVQRVDQITGRGPAAYAPKRGPIEPEQTSIVPPVSSPQMPSVRLPPSLDRAVAEIAARQHTLRSHAPASRPLPQPAGEIPRQTPPAQNLSGLEEQLRNITNQIETLRKPGVEQAINALREELAEIGRTLSDAMPRRALEAIEKQIQGLDRRIAESRQAGIDDDALGGIEHGLSEIRDAMRGLMPAENLIGFNEAVANLAHKIDLIVAQNDPATFAQLEHAITALREMSNHIASNETVHGLSAQVLALGEKIDSMSHGGGVEALNHLEQRIAMLSDTLAERAHHGGAASPRLEALIESLTDKIEQLHHSQGAATGFGHLEDYIVKLVEKLDASDARLGHLEGIERGLSDLLLHFENMRPDAGGLRTQGTSEVNGLRHDIARTQDALEAVHGTLGHVVDRLVTIENDIRVQARPPSAPDNRSVTRQPAFVADAPSIAAPMPSAAPTSAPIVAPAQRRLPPAAHLPSDPNLPENQPLEPGSGPPHLQGDPAARIAASEAALGGTAPAPAAGGKSSFIAAARRAAQAAGQQPNSRAQRPEQSSSLETKPSLRAKVMKRVKSLFIAASIIAIVVGSTQIAGSLFNFSSPFGKLAEGPATVRTVEPETLELAADDVAPEATGSIAAMPPALPNLPALAPLAPASGNNIAAINPPPAANPLTPAMPSLFGPPMLAPKGGITGSIPQYPPAASQAAPPPVLAPQSANQLPAAIGGAKLRTAAMTGDAAAAYTVAMRFAEGRGVPINMEEAARWYERAASKGLVPAQFRYASLLEKGLGVKKDLGAARKLYLAAAGKGNSKAMHNLAVLYAEGIDGKPDYGSAVQWFRKAARHGVADSQYNLAVLCARGLGTEQNYPEAYKWFALAGRQGDAEADKKRDDVATHLDSAALVAAQQTVESFVPEPQPQDAITVREPPGGWDHAAGASARGNPRPPGPLALGDFKVGKR